MDAKQQAFDWLIERRDAGRTFLEDVESLAGLLGGRWQPIETVPAYAKNGERSVLLMLPSNIAAAGRRRYGVLGEPDQDTMAWRTDCCGRYDTPTQPTRIR